MVNEISLYYDAWSKKHQIYHNDEEVKCPVIGQAGPGLRLHSQCVMCDSLTIMSLPCTGCGHKAALEKASKKMVRSCSACNNKFCYIRCSHSGFDDSFPLVMALFRLVRIYGRFGGTFSLYLLFLQFKKNVCSWIALRNACRPVCSVKYYFQNLIETGMH